MTMNYTRVMTVVFFLLGWVDLFRLGNRGGWGRRGAARG